MKFLLKTFIFCILIFQFIIFGGSTIMLHAQSANVNLTDTSNNDNIVKNEGGDTLPSESNLQYVDNDVKIPPITDTGPPSALVSDSVQVESDLSGDIDESANKDLNQQNVLDQIANPPSVIDIGFNEAPSQNSGLSDGLTESAFPTVVSLVDTASEEFRASLKDENTAQAFPSNVTSSSSDVLASNANLVNDAADDRAEYIVKAEPKIVLHPADISSKTKNDTVENSVEGNPANETQNSSDIALDVPVLDVESNKPKPSETMPVFSEWAQKQLEEAEKNKEEVNVSTQNLAGKNKTIKSVNLKHTSKNYASPDCNAKIISANPESSSMSSVLSPLRDEYALNTCTSKIWFVVELCESIQAKRIDLANFELFSSSPKDFSISVSARFPTRDWSNVGQFTAKDERTIQSFDLHPHLFGKYIKVEVQSHYGKEHFCPVSLFRVYGTSEFEAFETENPTHPAQNELDEDGELEESLNVDEKNQTESNLFGSARDAVMSIMKKAAEVLTKSVDTNKNITVTNGTSLVSSKSRICRTPSHIIVCDNCSDLLYSELYQILSCCNEQLEKLINNSLIKKLVHNTNICSKYGLDFSDNASMTVHNDTLLFFMSAFDPKYVVAVCNAFAILEKKVVLNTSYEDVVQSDSNSKIADNKTPIILETDTLLPSTNYIKDHKPNDRGDKPTGPTKDEHIISHDAALNVQTENTLNSKIISTETSADANVEPTQTGNSNDLPEKTTQKEISNSDDEILPSVIQDNKNENELSVNSTDQPEVPSEDNLKFSNQDNINESFENIFIDLESNDSLPTLGAVNTATTSSPANTNIQNVPKESILIRLSNRIKALERNMSLSGQYLEELSRRYRNKVEELHLAFDSIKTTILEESKNRIQQDQKKSEEIMVLQQQVLQLTNEIRALTDEKNSIQSRIWWILQFVLIVIVIVYVFMELFYKSNKQFEDKKVKRKRNTIKRRKSVEGVSGHISPTLKKRRPSTEALNISGTYKDLLKQESLTKIDHPFDEVLALHDLQDGPWFVTKADRKKKRKKAQRSISSVAVTLSGDSKSVLRRSSTFEMNVCNSDTKILNGNCGKLCATDEVFTKYCKDLHDMRSSNDASSTVQALSENGSNITEKKVDKVSSPGFLRSTLYRSKTSKSHDKNLQHKTHNWEWYRRKKNTLDSLSSGRAGFPMENMDELPASISDLNSDSNSINSSLSSSVNSNNLIERKDRNKTYFKKIFKRVF